MLEWMYNTEKLEEQINGNIQFIILENQDSLAIGYASFEKTEDGNGKLHKIYTHPDFKQKGGGSVLLNEIINIAHSMNVKVLELNVNRYNTAVEFYLKKGFTIKEEIDLDVGNGFFMNDYVMRYELWIRREEREEKRIEERREKREERREKREEERREIFITHNS